MDTADIIENRPLLQACLGQALGENAKLLDVIQLPASTRSAPWRLEVEQDDRRRAFVLRLGGEDLEYEYAVLKAMEQTSIPAPHAYFLDAQGTMLGAPCFLSDFISGEPLHGLFFNPVLISSISTFDDLLAK